MLLSTIIPIPMAIPESDMTFNDMRLKNIKRKTLQIEIGMEIIVIKGMPGRLKNIINTINAARIPISIEITKLIIDILISPDESSISSIVRSLPNSSFIFSRLSIILLETFNVPLSPVLKI